MMKQTVQLLMIAAMVCMPMVATAQRGGPPPRRGGPPPQHYVRHRDWVRGHRMARSDWRRGRAVNYRNYHLNAPPRGYQWREVDGNYVLAAVATGVIASVIAASAAH